MIEGGKTSYAEESVVGRNRIKCKRAAFCNVDEVGFKRAKAFKAFCRKRCETELKRGTRA